MNAFGQNNLFCEICKAELPGFDAMQYHMTGKRHKQMVEFWEKRKQQAELSIYVRGYPNKTTEQELFDYFSQFGRVTKVAFAKTANIYAIIEFSSRETVHYVLNHPNHILNSQRLIIRPREIDAPNQPPRNRHEAGYRGFDQGPDLGEDMRFGGPGPSFRGPGPRGMRFDPRDMGPPDMMGPGPGPRGPRHFNPPMRFGPGGEMGFDVDPSMMMQMDHGTGLMEPVYPGSSSSKKKKKKLQDSVEAQVDQYYYEDTMEKLNGVKGVQAQLEWLCQHLQVTADEAQMKFRLCETLQTTLAQFFPGCTVNQFGSSVNGFGITGCDMDIFLDFSTCTPNWTNQPIELPYVRDIRSLNKKLHGPLTPQEVSRLNMMDQCKLVSRIITEHVPGCGDINIVPSPRCPLVRFRHEVSGVKCDLSMNNSLALQNTKLLYLYSVLNSRVRLLVYAVRYWAKVKAIAGNPQSGTRLSNYALTLMVLCYLQNVDPPVLPTIEQLSQLHGPNNRTRIEGWDCTFAMDWQVIPSSNNTQSPAELLSGFFAFYSAYDFPNTVLIAHTGGSMTFADFLNKENMSDGRVRHFKAGAVNIQDPFVLDQNVCINVNQKTLDIIMREFRIATIKTATWARGDSFFINDESVQGGDIISLLSPDLPDIIKQEDQEKAEAMVQKGQPKPRKEGDPYDFFIELKPSQLTSKYLKNLQKTENYRVEWCRRVCAFITKILREIIILKCEELPEVRRDEHGEEIAEPEEQGAEKKPKLDEEPADDTDKEEENEQEAENVPEEVPLRLKKPSTADVNFQYYIKSFCRTWSARKKVKQYLTNEGYDPSGLGMEKLISETIYQNENAPYPNAIIGFYFEMESNISEKITGIDVKCEPMEGQKEFNCFFQFLKMFVTKMIDKYQCS